MDEFYLVNDVKEQLCFISDNVRQEMKGAEKSRIGTNWFDRDYVLPDFVETFVGRVRLPLELERNQAAAVSKTGDGVRNVNGVKETVEGEHGQDEKEEGKQNDPADKHNMEEQENDSDSENESEEHARQRILKQREEERRRRELEEQERQVLSLSTERFAVPEVMFRPQDIGLNQVSIAEGIYQAIEACDEIYRGAMYNNILLTGGNMKIPYIRDRLEREVRKLAPDKYDVRIYLPDDPVTYAWKGAQHYITSSNFICTGSVDRFDWENLKEDGKSIDEIWGDSNLPKGLVII